MPFEYCCFVSYPHGQDNVLVPFVKSFVEGLETEISALTRRGVFFDINFLKPGDRVDERIGTSLCKSACMIVIYTPVYFDRDHIYCAREFKAMQDLEEERLGLLGRREQGLIIPIVLRGPKYFPEKLKNERFYRDFSAIEFNHESETIRTKYSKEIKEIAEYIFDRCNQLKGIEAKLPNSCENYTLPSEDAAKKFVEEESLEVASHFPGRS